MIKTGVKLRRAVAGDSDVIASIWFGSWHATHGPSTAPEVVAWRDTNWFTERSRKMIERTIVAELAKGMIGFVTWSGTKLELLFLNQNAYGSGAGDLLLSAAESVLLNSGVNRPYLYCRMSNSRALSFYQKRGWVVDEQVEEQLACASGTRPSLVWQLSKTLG